MASSSGPSLLPPPPPPVSSTRNPVVIATLSPRGPHTGQLVRAATQGAVGQSGLLPLRGGGAGALQSGVSDLEASSPLTPLNPSENVMGNEDTAEGDEEERRARRRALMMSRKQTIEDLPDLTERINKMGMGMEYAAFRERYLAWRKGEAQGAHGDPLHLKKQQGSTGFGFWYPTVEEWKWRRTLSYWIAVTFFEGSIFFTVSSFLYNYKEKLGPFYEALTTGGYIAGKILFFICTYLMCIETVNLGAEGHSVSSDPDGASSDSQSDESIDDSDGGAPGANKFDYNPLNFRRAFANLAKCGCGPWPYIASVLYFFGVLLFAVALVLEQISSIPKEINEPLINVFFLLGAIGFFVGGVAECIENETFTSLELTKGWIGALFNVLGGLGFLVGSVFMWIDGWTWWSNTTFGIGSLIYVIGSSVMIIMWKDEQFGLTFLAVLNKLGGPSGRPMISKDTADNPEEARFSPTGVIFIHVYCVAGAMSVYNFALEVALAENTEEHIWRGIQLGFMEFLPFLFCHATLALASAVVRVPKVAPYRQLYQFCRALAFVLMVESCCTFYGFISGSILSVGCASLRPRDEM